MSASLYALTDELFRKAAVGTVQEVSGLLNKGVDVDIYEDEENALYHAIMKNRLDVVELLVMRGADVDTRDLFRHISPLSLAAWFGFNEIADFLLRNKAAINTQELGGNTALHRATKNDRVEVARLLLKNKADYSIQNFYLKDPIQCSKSVAMRALFEEQIAKDKIEKAKEIASEVEIGVDVDFDVEIHDENVKKKFNQ